MTTPSLLPRAQLAIGIGYLAIFIGFSLWARFDVPYGDDWDWILAVLTGQDGLAGLLQPHNEHVIPLARLLMSAQLAVGGLTGQLIQYVSLACQLAIIWLFWREVSRRWPAQPEWRWTVGGLVMVCLSFTQQLQSLIFAAAALFTLVQFWATLAIVAWLNADEARASGAERQRFWWWCSVVCAAGAAASTTSGVVVPAILGLLTWLRRGRTREVVGWSAVCAALAIAYVGWVGLGVPTDGSGVVEPSPTSLVLYAFAVLSSGLPYVHPGAAVVLGAVVFLLAMVAVVSALRRRTDLARIELFALAQIVFGLACTVMVTPGRAQFGVLQAAQSRYATFVLCLWAALIMFHVSRWARREGAGAARSRAIVMWGALALSAAMVVPNVYMGLLWRAKADNLNASYLALRSGVLDPVWVTGLHPLPVVIGRTIDAMAIRGVSVDDPVLHTRVTELPTATCEGDGRLVRQSRDGGLTLDGQWHASLTDGVVIDVDGVVVGMTMPAPWVREPAPTPAQVHQAVMREVRGMGRSVSDDRPWLGFAQTGGGAPYRWLGTDKSGTWTCTDALTVTSAVHATLDRVNVAAGDVVQAFGWAFACGEGLTAWTLLIDGTQVESQVTSDLPRPDVQAVFADGCAPDSAAGVHLSARAGVLSPGTHTATLTVVSASGAIATSNVVTFVVPTGGTP